jgi:hypothetical protein
MERRNMLKLIPAGLLAGFAAFKSTPKKSRQKSKSRQKTKLGLVGPMRPGEDRVIATGPCTVERVEFYHNGSLVYVDTTGAGGVSLPLCLASRETLSFRFPDKWRGRFWGRAVLAENIVPENHGGRVL